MMELQKDVNWNCFSVGVAELCHEAVSGAGKVFVEKGALQLGECFATRDALHLGLVDAGKGVSIPLKILGDTLP